MKFTHKLPKKPGFYWFTNFGEHTPTVLRVTKDHNSGKLYASDEEFSFEVEDTKFEKDPDMKVGKHYYGEQMWCEIPVPTLDGKKIKWTLFLI
jgi:hypothetical protein